mmetsp:Transcript_18902/g.22464  ORF Transcript_18902/g.22464 Transcript_18902/m.22464 type:complete len:201 (-) Transcript_18902:95-697(-)
MLGTFSLKKPKVRTRQTPVSPGDESDQSDDENWQLAAAMANAVAEQRAIEKAEEAQSATSYLTSFWSRGSAKKTPKPPIASTTTTTSSSSMDVPVDSASLSEEALHPTSLGTILSAAEESTNSDECPPTHEVISSSPTTLKDIPDQKDTNEETAEASDDDDVLKDGTTDAGVPPVSRSVGNKLLSPKRTPWTASKFMCAE